MEGQLLKDQYYVLELVGQGATGVVYRAFDRNLQSPVALKTMRIDAPSTADLERMRDSLRRDARLARQLNGHPNIVTVHDLFEMGFQVIVVMEYVDGPTLQSVLKNGALPRWQVLALLKDIASALDFAWQKGIVHRDIKPSNVLVTQDRRAKVADFGIAWETANTMTTAGIRAVGTPAYMSPEQLLSQPVSGASDQYALAILAYEMLTLALPFGGDTESAIVARTHGVVPQLNGSKLGQDAIAVLQRALSFTPAHRYGSCTALVEELERALKPPPPPPVDDDPADEKPWWGSRRLAIAAAALAALAVLTAAVLLPGSDFYRRFRSPITNSRDKMPYVWIPAGTFQMGCVPDDTQCDPDEKPRHEVSLTKGFWIGQTEVTVEAYERFAAARSVQLPEPPSFNAGWRSKKQPMNAVTWNEAAAYCGWAGGRLPTEAEWEYAARGGQANLIFPWGNPVNHENANYGDDESGVGKVTGHDQWAETAPVASFPASPWDLFDTSGNVSEWVADWYGANYYGQSAAVDPQGPVTGEVRAFRGGSYTNFARALRNSWRGYGRAERRGDNVGLRCVLTGQPGAN